MTKNTKFEIERKNVLRPIIKLIVFNTMKNRHFSFHSPLSKFNSNFFVQVFGLKRVISFSTVNILQTELHLFLVISQTNNFRIINFSSLGVLSILDIAIQEFESGFCEKSMRNFSDFEISYYYEQPRRILTEYFEFLIVFYNFSCC